MLTLRKLSLAKATVSFMSPVPSSASSSEFQKSPSYLYLMNVNIKSVFLALPK